MTRIAIPNRRRQVTEIVTHITPSGESPYTVTFGVHAGRVLEVFCSSPKSGSDSQATVNDACIAISLLLQHGMTMEQLAAAFGENRNEGEKSGPPSSVLGAIARAGAAIDAVG